jgi:hypothetical protein
MTEPELTAENLDSRALLALARDESSFLAAHPDAIDFDRSPPGRQRRRPLAPCRRITRPKSDPG